MIGDEMIRVVGMQFFAALDEILAFLVAHNGQTSSMPVAKVFPEFKVFGQLFLFDEFTNRFAVKEGTNIV
jgi:hypothetical protein